MKAPFKTCHICGAALDPGERCDCTEDKPIPASERANAENARLVPPEALYYGPHGAEPQPQREATLGARPIWPML